MDPLVAAVATSGHTVQDGCIEDIQHAESFIAGPRRVQNGRYARDESSRPQSLLVSRQAAPARPAMPWAAVARTGWPRCAGVAVTPE